MSALVGDCPPRSRPTTCRRRVGSTCRAFPPLYSVASVCVCGVPSCAAGAPYLRCSRIPHSYNKTARRAAGRGVERATGIEPASEAWEASILPMNYARNSSPRRNRPVDHIVTPDSRATGVGWAWSGSVGRRVRRRMAVGVRGERGCGAARHPAMTPPARSCWPDTLGSPD